MQTIGYFLFNCCRCFRDDDFITTQLYVDNDVIYDFLRHKNEYWKKCMPIIKDMKDRHLLQALSTVTLDNIEQFREQFSLNEDQFNGYDIQHIDYCRPLILQLLMEKGHVKINNENVKMLTKLVSKRYILQVAPTMEKVSCEILISNKKLKVNCYDVTKKGVHYFKNSKGSLEQRETIVDALLREMKEELGLTFPIDRYILLQHVHNMTTYQLIMDDEEYKKYIKDLKFKDLDVEITHIVLTNN
jgi:hypothetical protein